MTTTIVSGRNFSFTALKATRECVLNIPTADLAELVINCGNTSGRKIDKFSAFGIETKAASKVGAPLLTECFASLECRVVDTRMVNRYNFFVLEAVKAWVDTAIKAPRTLHHRGYGTFAVASETIALKSRMP